MALLGLPVGKPRLPHEPLTPDETAELRDVLRKEFELPVDGLHEVVANEEWRRR